MSERYTVGEILEHAQTYHPEMGCEYALEAFAEHGGFYVANTETGATWAAYECSGHECLMFEQISSGEY